MKTIYTPGEVFGTNIFIEELPTIKYANGSYARVGLFKCSCGKTFSTQLGAIKNGYIKSCGCVQLKFLEEYNKAKFKHKGCGTKEYMIWSKIKDRCLNPRYKKFENYGGRGITICKGWKEDFKNFIVDMGKKPGEGYSVERNDNNGNYSCGHCEECIENGWVANCRWATRKEQNKNKRSNVYLEFCGKTKTICEWGKEFNLSHSAIRKRLNAGLTIEQALTLPPQPGKSLKLLKNDSLL